MLIPIWLLVDPLSPPDSVQWLQALLLHVVLISVAQRLPLLTRAGWLHAGFLGTLLWGCLGPPGWGLVVMYFLLGSLATRVGFRQKQKRGLAEGRGGRRGPENVWGSAATGALLAVLVDLAPAPWRTLLLVGFVASFAAKLADTLGSEIGKQWGRHTWLITTLRLVPPGTEGAISVEGTLASVLGSAVMALVGLGLGLLDGYAAVILVALAGLAATLVESLIGATLQGRLDWLTNEMVNGLQTAVAALMAMAAWCLFAAA